MSERWPIFTHELAFDPAQDLEPFLKLAPAKWVVYLFADENDQPVQLLCVKNLRYSLKRRLGGLEMIGPTKKIDYRELVRKVYWRRVDSAFEADLVYLEAARKIFPQTYRGMVGMRPAWFVHVNPKTTYPRYVKTTNLTGQTGIYFGPLEDKHSAQKLVHLMENLFDLCRDYSVLVQSPHGGPCPWKQMDKCLGPCDGTISLEAYAQVIEFSTQVLADPESYLEEEKQRMQDAAMELRFETAQKIKSRVEQVAQLGKGPYRHLRPLRDFCFVSLQRGPWAGTAKVFLVTPGKAEEVAGLIEEPDRSSDLLRLIRSLAEERRHDAIDEVGVERIGVVSHQLFVAKNKQGVFLQIDEVEERAFAKAYKELLNQKAQPEVEDGEGVTKELQAM